MGVTYRGVHSSTYGLSVQTDPSLLPPITRKTISIPNRDGEYYFGTQYGARPIPITIGFFGADLVDYESRLRALADWLRPDLGEGEFVSDNESDKTYNCALSANDFKRLQGIAQAGQGTLTMIASDPKAYGAQQTLTLASATDASALFTLKASQQNDPDPVNAQPIFTMTFSATASSFQITHQESGNSLTINYNFSVGDVLVLDRTTEKITINDVLQQTTLAWATSEWFDLITGDNDFTFSPTGVASTQMKFKPNWL